MGIVQRQSLRNTVISYAGLGIGFVNTTLVVPRLLSPAQIGLTSVLFALATVAANMSAVGFASTTIRFFPYFRNRAAGHFGFLPLQLGLPLLAFVVVATGLVLSRPLVLHWYEKDAALLAPHYFVSVGLALCLLLYLLFDAYLRALFRSAFSSFLQEIVLRFLTLTIAVAYALGYLSFDAYVLAYLGVYAAALVLLVLYVASIGELQLRPTRTVLTVRPLREMLGYGGFVLLTNLSGTILVSIDNFMVSGKLDFAAGGIYTIAFNISTALALPFRALYKTAAPLVAEYWKAGDFDKLADFYRRATRLNTVLGCYLGLGIALNLGFVYALVGRPEYAAGASAVLLLLVGRLVDGVTGLNGIIVLASPRYRTDLLFNLALTVLIVGLNWLLIPRLGLAGAALGNCLALSGINLIRTWFVWRVYGWQPFDRRILIILLVAAAAGSAAWLLPAAPNKWLDLLLRGGTFTGLYALGLLLTRAVPEVQAVWQKIYSRIFSPSN